MDEAWLFEVFKETGLAAEQAQTAAEATLQRLLKRKKAPPDRRGRKLVQFMVRDPLASMNRIVGKGDEGLPFVDPDTGGLSAAAFANVLSSGGVDPVVALAYAKVVVEAFEPSDIYQPIWAQLGHEGPVDLEVLRREDWTPLSASTDEDEQATRQVAVQPPRR